MPKEMSEWIDLIAETVSHFEEGAKSVRAYTEDTTFIITKGSDSGYVVATEEPGFPKKKTVSLEEYFKNVFGIEARY